MAIPNPANGPSHDELAPINEVSGSGPNAHMEGNAKTSTADQNGSANPTVPPPKTDKPRPHVCTTCSRSFARLEHLKRHERSHTKEKPFECPECSRCFARRDLLLRHQQKLHQTTTPSSRPRNGRRESASNVGVGSGRVRKNSIANERQNMRPRANTISHVDNSALEMLQAANGTAPRPGRSGHTHHPSLSSVTGPSNGMDFHSMGTAPHGGVNGLTRIDTTGLSLDVSNGGLRTAPIHGSFPQDFGIHDMMLGHGSTINPAQLHFGGSPLGLNDSPASPFQAFPGMSHSNMMPDEDPAFDWINGFDSMTFTNPHQHLGHPNGGMNESAIDESSPSAMSTGSQSGISEVMLDGSKHAVTSAAWQTPFPAQTQASSNQFSLDFPTFQDLGVPPETISPKSMMAQNPFGDPSFSTSPPLTSMSPNMMGGVTNGVFHSPMTTNGDLSGSLNAQLSGNRISNLSGSSDTITDSTRQALLTSLSQPTAFGHRKYSQSSNNNTPVSPGVMSRQGFTNTNNTYLLPSTLDLQRYITAYVNYFHPHLPFLHIPSLNFQTPEFTQNSRLSGGPATLTSSGINGGGGCLILSMAAIGALYEFDTATSKDLFESAKKMIQLYLEERRKADMSAVLGRANPGRENSVHNTPLWLVQAMLLNVIYGHNCGDKTSADIASTHCAALVSLARAAELTQPLPSESLPVEQWGNGSANGDVQMNGAESESMNGQGYDMPAERREWLKWKIVEERKRTLYAIFTLSSMLVSAYNHAPALTNSEIRLDLPCEEDIWAAESPQAWRMLGGAAAAEQKSISFSAALTSLLTASQRQQRNESMTSHGSYGAPSMSTEDVSESELKPSTFGCLVLIHALHNYIWETRQRHMGRQWTARETDAMHAHIEPALRAWQAAWASNPRHGLERPNPYGMGPLSADSIPLLDLAYVRLFVNLGRSKEAFWQRDWNAMADELAKGNEIIQHADDGSDSNGSPAGHADPSNRQDLMNFGHGDYGLSQMSTQDHPLPSGSTHNAGQSRRERHLRKAAFYAADSMCMSDRLGNTFAEFTSRELPLQCAMCAFDCAQILAEWVTTVQERIGPYLGLLGRDEVDLNQVPGIMLLEDEDCKLLDKIKEILNSIENKTKHEAQNSGTPVAINSLNRLPSMVEGGYGSKVLMSTAYLLDRAAVWPVTKLMARSLETQALRMKERAENSVILTT